MKSISEKNLNKIRHLKFFCLAGRNGKKLVPTTNLETLVLYCPWIDNQQHWSEANFDQKAAATW